MRISANEEVVLLTNNKSTNRMCYSSKVRGPNLGHFFSFCLPINGTSLGKLHNQRRRKDFLIGGGGTV